jgi:hemoglobin-like flavoprotein
MITLTQREKILVTQSYMKVELNSEHFTDLFYQRLFEIAPETRPLFNHSNLREQKRKLAQTISMAVRSLNRFEAYLPNLKALGQKHITYGISTDMYAYVGEALIWTLEQSLGNEFTAEVKEAWEKIYALLTEVMTSVYVEAKEQSS